MTKFVDDFVGGAFFGIIFGTITAFMFWLWTLDNTISFREMKRDIDNNVSVKQITYKKFPNEYKLHYTDWKDLK